MPGNPSSCLPAKSGKPSMSFPYGEMPLEIAALKSLCLKFWKMPIESDNEQNLLKT
jgi:hypothetical protein